MQRLLCVLPGWEHNRWCRARPRGPCRCRHHIASGFHGSGVPHRGMTTQNDTTFARRLGAPNPAKA